MDDGERRRTSADARGCPLHAVVVALVGCAMRDEVEGSCLAYLLAGSQPELTVKFRIVMYFLVLVSILRTGPGLPIFLMNA